MGVLTTLEMNPRIVWQLAEAVPGLLATPLGNLKVDDKFSEI